MEQARTNLRELARIVRPVLRRRKQRMAVGRLQLKLILIIDNPRTEFDLICKDNHSKQIY